MVEEKHEVKPVELSFPEDNEIQRLHQEIDAEATAFANRVSDNVVRIGQLLTERKAKLRHGQFERWVEQRHPFTVRTAQRYMKAFSNCNALADSKRSLSVQEAVQLVLPGKTIQEMSPKSDSLSFLSGAKTESNPARNSSGATNNADSTPAEPEPKDPDKRVIPEYLRPTFAVCEQFEKFAQALSTLKGQVTQAVAADPVAWGRLNMNAFEAGIGKLRELLTMSSPYIVCSYCSGDEKDKDNCTACKGSGFLTKGQAYAVPRELRGEAT